MIEILDLTKQYKNGYVANANISLRIGKGEIFGLLGPNGAGKTTLVNQLIGLIKPTSGTITIDGMDVVANPALSRSLCCFQPQSQIPIDGLTPLEAIELTGCIRGMSRQAAKKQAKILLGKLELDPWAQTRGENLSGGIRRLTAFCMTCVAPAKVVILDEPTNDVDPKRRRLLWKEIRAIAERGSSVILVTHNVLEAERSTDRLGIIHKSRLLRQGTPGSFRSNPEKSMILELTLEPGKALEDIPLKDFYPVQRGRRIFCSIHAGEVVEYVHLSEDLKRMQLIEEFSINPTSLEESYLKIISHEETDPHITQEEM